MDDTDVMTELEHAGVYIGLAQVDASAEAVSELERFIGTFETYGVWTNVKPCLSTKAIIPADLLKRGA